MNEFDKLVTSDDFMESLFEARFARGERRAIYKALVFLNSNELHPSLRVHALQGDLAGIWSASVTNSIRIEFVRLADGRRRLLRCSRHYDR